MGICFFNGLDESHCSEEFIYELLDKSKDINLTLRDMDINYCRCCGGCEKLGECVIKDDAEHIYNGYKESEVIILLTNVKYGGYSKTLKKAIDRTMPFGESKLDVKEGYMTHRMKYSKRRVLIIGVGENLSKFEKEAFNDLCYANYINFDWEKYDVLLVDKNKIGNLKAEIQNSLKEVM